jgi:glycosyltransferase involved in cell wall biosynthesis
MDLKIAFISTCTYPTPPRTYGGEIFFWDLCCAFSQMGHFVHLFASTGSKCPPNGKLTYNICTYGKMANRVAEANIPKLYMPEILDADYIIDASHEKLVMQDVWNFHREHAWKTINVLNGLVTGWPMCHKWNIVVGSQKWKDLSLLGLSQFYETPWAKDYGDMLTPLPPGSIVAVIPWATNTEFYCPDDYSKEDYFLWFCYDEKTEVLTKSGWKYFRNVKSDEEIATLNPDEELEYQKPIALQQFYYKGEMVHIKGRGHDLLVTPNHQIFCRYGFKGKRFSRIFRLISAEALIKLVQQRSKSGKPELKRNLKWNGNDIDHFTLPSITITQEKSGPNKKLPPEAYDEARRLRSEGLGYWSIAKALSSKYGTISAMPIYEALNKKPKPRRQIIPEKRFPLDIWLQFFGWWITKGSAYQGENGHYQVILSQNANSNFEEMKEITKKLGFSFYIRVCSRKTSFGKNKLCQIVITNKQLYHYLKDFGKAKNKYLPEWVKNLPSSRLQMLLETMLKGDRNPKTFIYMTGSSRLADDVQEIALKAGYTATISSEKNEYFVVIGKRNLTPAICATTKLINYEGLVYDLTVPKHHIILVRRNGKPTWSSNSRPTPYKGLHRAIRLSQDMGFRLVVAMPMEISEHQYFGEHYLEQIKKAVAKGAKIEFVKLPGDSRHHIVKRELYRKAKALLFTIEAHEPFGLTVIEALACGTPVIASRMGAMPEIIKHGETGYLSHIDSNDGFKMAVENINSGQIEAKACVEDARKRFDRSVAAARYIELWQKLSQPLSAKADSLSLSNPSKGGRDDRHVDRCPA